MPKLGVKCFLHLNCFTWLKMSYFSCCITSSLLNKVTKGGFTIDFACGKLTGYVGNCNHMSLTNCNVLIMSWVPSTQMTITWPDHGDAVTARTLLANSNYHLFISIVSLNCSWVTGCWMSTACISNVMQADIPLMLYFSLEVLVIFQMCTRVFLNLLKWDWGMW